jgi:two-component sensor histidine kinase
LTRFAVIRSAISSDKSHATRAFIALAAVLGATLLRFALSPLSPNLVFVTYYPAVLICSALAGWRYGLASASLSGIIAEIYFQRPFGTIVANAPTLISYLLFLSSCAVIIATGDTLRRSVRDLEQANRLADTLNGELHHRVRNMLTVVQALASQAAKATNPQAFAASFGRRLQALATAHELLGRRNLETCTLPELIDEACEPFCAGANIAKSGPACELPSVSCVPLVLALHELCTNALKYGALSNSEGTVEISWSFADGPHRLVIDWREIGGPVVSKPTSKGLGSALLRAQPGIAELNLRFEKSGVCCTIGIDGATPVGASGSGAPLLADLVTLAAH